MSYQKRRKCDQEEVTMDMTPMIDVVFLLIIFFILMPPKEMEGQLESYLPNAPSDIPKTDEEPPPIFNIVLKSRLEGNDEVRTSLEFNNSPIGEFVTLSIPKLNQIYNLDKAEKRSILGEEHKRDERQFNPAESEVISRLITRMESAANGSSKGKETDVMISSSSNVPFKVVLAILNAGATVKFPNLKFVAPDASIFRPDP